MGVRGWPAQLGVAASLGVLLAMGWYFWAKLASKDGDLQAIREQKNAQLQTYHDAWVSFERAGLRGIVELHDFGNGVGVRLSPHNNASHDEPQTSGTRGAVPNSTLLFSFPGSLAVDLLSASGPLAQQLKQDITSGRITPLTACLGLFLAERRADEASPLAAFWRAVPDRQWHKENGIFSIPDYEFNLTAFGTTMEHWKTQAVEATNAAWTYLSEQPAFQEPHLSIDEVRWAYMLVHSHGIGHGNARRGGVVVEPAFMAPVLFMRPTPEERDAVRILWNDTTSRYEVYANEDTKPGEELYAHSPLLSDASLLAYRGLWYPSRHRMQVTLNLTDTLNRPNISSATVEAMRRHGCIDDSNQLSFWIKMIDKKQKIPPVLLSCMRLLAVADTPNKYGVLERKNWFGAWPITRHINQQNEAQAAQTAKALLDVLFDQLMSVNVEIREKLGKKTTGDIPSMQVRMAEVEMLVSLITSMKDLEAIASNQVMYEAYHVMMLEEWKKKHGTHTPHPSLTTAADASADHTNATDTTGGGEGSVLGDAKAEAVKNNGVDLAKSS